MTAISARMAPKDIMDPDEILVGVVSLALAAVGLGRTSTARMPGLYLRGMSGAGLNRVATVLAMVWILVVLLNFADPSVKGIYFWFYVVMGYAAIKAVASLGVSLFGIRFRVDVCERRNPAAALLHAALVLATGMIFGGCLWGEADPDGEGEGGWWIPVGFFLAGWAALLIALALFFWREPGPTRVRIRRDRNVPEAKAAGAYAIAAAWVLTEAVSGDFHGWRQGLLAVGFVFGLLIIHEIFTFTQTKLAGPLAGRGRTWESLTYVGTGLLFWWLSRSLEKWLAAFT